MLQQHFFIVSMYPLDTERKVNVHETFRRRPGMSYVPSIYVVCLGVNHLFCISKLYKATVLPHSENTPFSVNGHNLIFIRVFYLSQLVLYRQFMLINSGDFTVAFTGTGFRSSRPEVLKKVFLENSQNSQENTCARFSFLIKSQA